MPFQPCCDKQGDAAKRECKESCEWAGKIFSLQDFEENQGEPCSLDMRLLDQVLGETTREPTVWVPHFNYAGKERTFDSLS